MRKFNKQKRLFIINRQRRIIKKQKRRANYLKRVKQLFKIIRLNNPEYFTIRELRKQRRKAVYKYKDYNDTPIIIDVDGELGLEEGNGIKYFLEKASNIIDSNSKNIYIDLTKCNRLWPSGITLFCSLHQWVTLKSNEMKRPRIASSSSENKRVNSYLSHCGFYDYVGRPKDVIDEYYSQEQVVKVKHIQKRNEIEAKEEEVRKLIKKYSNFDTDQFQWFDCVVLTEVLNNVSEHGIPKADTGIWLLCQYHKLHSVISLCIADNGIGIRNSLMTGPQRNEILKKVQDEPDKEGEIIKMALEENISGALEAPLKKGFIIKRYESGARRGNGLKRIMKVCHDLHVPFTILSHYGYVFNDGDGNMKLVGAKNNKVFAGTMYHFLIPARKDNI